MLKRTLPLLLVAYLLAGSAWAATDSFVGDWKLNASRSVYMDQMKVQSLGGNTYVFDFGGGPERIVADGTEQSGYFGTMLAVSIAGTDSLQVVRKKDGRMLVTAGWKLSMDGNSIRDRYTDFGPGDSASTADYLYKRTAAGSGFAGTWEGPIGLEKYAAAFRLQIEPYEETGLSFIQAAQAVTRNVKFDGKEYPGVGRGVAEGSTASARRVNARTLEITGRVKGKVTSTERVELSADLKTLTRTVHTAGRRQPSVFVFERQ